MKRSVVLSLLALVALLSLSTTSTAAPSAEDLFKQGREAVQQKNWKRAQELLTKSWALKKSFDTAALLGQAELRLDQHRAAAEHLDYALRHFPNLSPAPDARERIEQGLETAKQHVYALTLDVKPDGAEVFVDTDSVGRAPLEAPIYLEPGPHQVEATLEGHERAGKKVEATAGQKGKLALELAKGAGAATAPPAPTATPTATPPPRGDPPITDTPAPATEPGKKSMVPVIVAGGVAVLGLAGALVFELSRSSAASDADDIAKTLDPKGCGTGTSTPDECAELHDKNKSKESAENYRNASLVTAGVASVALVTYLLWPSKTSSTTAVRRTTITPMLSRTKAGLSLSGRF